MALAAGQYVSEAEYLSNLGQSEYEWVDGILVHRGVPNTVHGRVQGKCFRVFDEHFEQHDGGYAAVELHCRLSLGRSVSFRLPDIGVVFSAPAGDGILEQAPDLAIEVRSPGDRLPMMTAKAEEYFAAGSRMVWLVLPDEQAVLVLQPSRDLKAYGPEDTIDLSEFAPGLLIPVQRLFPQQLSDSPQQD